ncbi:hypothetical protein B0A49_11659 [Cryomyces minteri]|uniref:MOSC domain-containing protein n=1 Tax=Cryomyces minteri TaxID=331657 RepID=A0A4U0WBH4_9PEZI|nr:hypothetical protein B0A49_11659 [Cryomyces minteri]
MKISHLYTYPIKSLRETPISEAEVSKHGFLYDRRFMILKVHDDPASPSGRRYENMHVAYFPDMTLFSTTIDFPNDGDEGKITVTFRAPGGGEPRTLEVPLKPDIAGLETMEVVMHNSPTKAYNMGSKYNDWFNECFGYKVAFAYLGENLRSVLMTSKDTAQSQRQNSWLSSITSSIPLLGSGADDEDKITFQDCAPYLIVTQASLNDVSSRLDGEEMDASKFRPNIILEGTDSEWDEDFWGEIAIGDTKISLVQNCVRCQSINIDYATAKQGATESGKVFKKLQRDRRVDAGHKYSPVFGRYGFLTRDNTGTSIAVGDEVTVTKRNQERTKFDWPGLCKT